MEMHVAVRGIMYFLQISVYVTSAQIDPANLNQMYVLTNLLTKRLRTTGLQMVLSYGVMDNDDISDYNQYGDLLQLMDLLNDEDDDEKYVEEDVIDFLLTYFDHITSKNRFLKTCKVFLGTPGIVLCIYCFAFFGDILFCCW